MTNSQRAGILLDAFHLLEGQGGIYSSKLIGDVRLNALGLFGIFSQQNSCSDQKKEIMKDMQF